MIEESKSLSLTYDISNVSQKLFHRINDFHVFVLYNQSNDFSKYYNPLEYNIEKLKGKLINEYIFPKVESETFIVWDRSYKENKKLFSMLRLKARNEVVLRVTEYLIANFLNKYEHYLVASWKNNPEIKWGLLKKLFIRFESLIRNDTFLSDERVWEDFIEWFKPYLIEGTLNEMVETYGYHQLVVMNTEELNNLFIGKMNGKLAEDNDFMRGFIKIVNTYVEDWVNRIIEFPELQNMTIEDIFSKFKIDIELNLFFKKQVQLENLFVMSNAVYQTVKESISNQHFTYKSREDWPEAVLNNSSIKGRVQFIPHDTSGIVDKVQFKKMREYAESLSEIDVDVYDILCSFYLDKSRHSNDTVEISIDDFLAKRGLKPKLSGNGRRGGYEQNQRTQILKSLSIIQSLWIDIEEVLVYKRSKPVRESLQGRAFIFNDLNNEPLHLEKHSLKDKFLVKIGKAFIEFLYGSGRQVKLLPIKVLEYDPYREMWEKKLIRYLSWRWRTQARNGSYLQPHKINTLLMKIGFQTENRTPSRVRDRIENALDVLQEDGMIASWQYEMWDESITLKKGWLDLWKSTSVFITPPKAVIKHYQPLERKQTNSKRKQTLSLSNPTDEITEDIGEKIKHLRHNLQLTLQQAADEIELSVSYLSNIERGIKIPSAKVMDRIIRWLNVYSRN